ncbi:MAG TPA: hypothetical protein VNA13_04975 [Xanthomonadales bacterium]|nr:hypothetical protein [Xanthomonadales bacterium]
MTTIDLSEFDKAAVLAVLYNASKPQGMGFMQYDPTPMSVEEARSLLEQTTYFDYLKGRVMKIDLSGDTLDTWGYDRDNGENAASRVIDTLRSTKDVDNIVIHEQHIASAKASAAQTMELLYEDPSEFSHEGGVPTYKLGLDDLADQLRPKIEEARRKLEE